MSKWATRISEQLNQIGSMFQRDELAYLALTQKVEHAIRDKLAFGLHRTWAERESLLVCREWNRIDLAVLEGSAPVALVEAKAQYTFDIVKKGAPHNFPDLLLDDVRKVAPRRARDTEVFTLLLATHPESVPDKRCRSAIKYFGGLNKYAATFDLAEADSQIGRRLSSHPRATHGQIDGGTAFGTSVSVAYWLFGPYPPEV